MLFWKDRTFFYQFIISNCTFTMSARREVGKTCGKCFAGITFNEMNTFRRDMEQMRTEHWGDYHAMLSNQISSGWEKFNPDSNVVKLNLRVVFGDETKGACPKPRSCCRRCFMFANSLGKSTMDLWVQEEKMARLVTSTTIPSASLLRAAPARKDTAPFKSIREAEKYNVECIMKQKRDGVADAALIKWSLEEMQMMVVGKDERAIHCHHWLGNFFDLVGCYQPNSQSSELQLSSNFSKKIIYVEYNMDVDIFCPGMPSICFKTFCTLWSNAWPHVTIRKIKDVDSKCSDCYWLTQWGRYIRTRKEREMITMFRRHHMLGVMNQRHFHTHMRDFGGRNIARGEGLMVISLDGKSSDSTKLPWVADQCSPTHQWLQHIEGAIIEGHKNMFLASGAYIPGGANHTLSCLTFAVNEYFSHCEKEGRRKPRELFIPIDGGETFQAWAMHVVCETL